MNEGSKNLKARIVEWAAGQPFNNVLLLLICCGGAWFAWYSLTTAIPSHLQQIQAGYREIESQHREERQLIIQTYDKWMNSKPSASPTSVAKHPE